MRKDCRDSWGEYKHAVFMQDKKQMITGL